MYFEKAAKFCEISTVDLSYVVPVKSMVGFSEYMNFIIAFLAGNSKFLVSDSKLYNLAYILSYYYSNIIFDACYLLAYYDKMVILRVNVCNFVSSVHNIYIQNTTINNKLGAFQ